MQVATTTAWMELLVQSWAHTKLLQAGRFGCSESFENATIGMPLPIGLMHWYGGGATDVLHSAPSCGQRRHNFWTPRDDYLPEHGIQRSMIISKSKNEWLLFCCSVMRTAKQYLNKQKMVRKGDSSHQNKLYTSTGLSPHCARTHYHFATASAEH